MLRQRSMWPVSDLRGAIFIALVWHFYLGLKTSICRCFDKLSNVIIPSYGDKMTALSMAFTIDVKLLDKFKFNMTIINTNSVSVSNLLMSLS